MAFACFTIAAAAACAYAKGEKPTGSNTTENNGTVDVPTVKLAVKPVTADKVKSTVVADNYWKASEICTGKYAAACTKLGIQ